MERALPRKGKKIKKTRELGISKEKYFCATRHKSLRGSKLKPCGRHGLR